MSYGYSAGLIKLNKAANGRLLGVRLGRVCIANAIPVATVAAKLGVSRQTAYNWFTGSTNPYAGLVPAVEKFLAAHK